MATKIQVSKVMAKELNKAFKAKGWGYTATYILIDARGYGMSVGDIYEAESWGDYIDAKNAYRAIRIEYPADYYACNRYLSTKELNHLFKAGNTLQQFLEQVLEEVEI